MSDFQAFCDQLIASGQLEPVPMPRSWPREHLARWEALPRDLQLYLQERETQRDKEVRRAQNIAAELKRVMDSLPEKFNETAQAVA